MGTRGMSPCERLQTPKELLQSPVRRFDSARRLFVSVQVGSTHHAFTVFRAPARYRGYTAAPHERMGSYSDSGELRADLITSSR
jgi:hypothetical protein